MYRIKSVMAPWASSSHYGVRACFDFTLRNDCGVASKRENVLLKSKVNGVLCDVQLEVVFDFGQ